MVMDIDKTSLSEVMETVTRDFLTMDMDLDKNYKEFDLPDSFYDAIPMSEIW